MDAYYAQSGRRLKGGGSGESAPTGPGSDTTLQSIYLVLQILATGGLDLSVNASTQQWQALLFVAIMLSGLMVFTVLIGFVNETVSATIDGINQGGSRICLTGHTLILGWNQATVTSLCNSAVRYTFISSSNVYTNYEFQSRNLAHATGEDRMHFRVAQSARMVRSIR